MVDVLLYVTHPNNGSLLLKMFRCDGGIRTPDLSLKRRIKNETNCCTFPSTGNLFFFSALTTELHHTRIVVPIVGIEPTPSRILTGDFCVFQDLQTAFQTLDVIILTRL